MSTQTLPMDLRRVLDAPRGRRFSHTPHRPGTRPTPRPVAEGVLEAPPPLVSLGRTPREREVLAQMPDTPGLRRRLERGDLPERMRLAAARRAEEPARIPEPSPSPVPVPKPARTPDEDTGPYSPLPIPRPRRERVPPPPLPRRSDRPRRPAAHRKPRRRIGPLLPGYALAGAAAQPLITFLS